MSAYARAQRLGDYLEHIADACDDILEYEAYAKYLENISFLEKRLIQDASIRKLEIIGEALRNIGRYFPEYLKEHAELPAMEAYAMRNALAHGYFSVNMELVDRTIKNDIPPLAVLSRKLMQQVQCPPGT